MDLEAFKTYFFEKNSPANSSLTITLTQFIDCYIAFIEDASKRDDTNN